MNITKSHIVIVVQYKQYISLIKNQIETFWPNHDIYFILNPILDFYKPFYPEPEKVKIPYIGNLSWKKNKNEISQVWQVKKKEVLETTLSSLTVVNIAETIILMDLNTLLVLPFKILLEQSFGKTINSFKTPLDQSSRTLDKSYFIYDFKFFEEEEIEKTLKNPMTPDHSDFQETLNWAIAKRFFEYNFNFNSCIVFKPVLQKAGVADDDFVLTKYVLQLLFPLQTMSDFSESEMVSLMYNWKGTGLYPQCEMGGPTSYDRMFKNLTKAAIIKENKRSTIDKKHFDFTEVGRKLLKLIHPDCRDIDLPGKIHLWEDNWPESKKDMDEYLTAFFIKQMEFVPQEN